MDAERRELERRLAADPSDREAEGALLRARERAGEPIRQGFLGRLTAALETRRAWVLRSCAAILTEIQASRLAARRGARSGPAQRLTQERENELLVRVGKLLGRENEITGALYMGGVYTCETVEAQRDRRRRRVRHRHNETCRRVERVTDAYLETLTTEVAAMRREILPWVRAWMGLMRRTQAREREVFRAENIVSVQPMSSSPTGRIHYLDVVTGRTPRDREPEIQNIPPPPRSADTARLMEAFLSEREREDHSADTLQGTDSTHGPCACGLARTSSCAECGAPLCDECVDVGNRCSTCV